jgi:predicted Zn-dependent protease with MMP-like domain
MDNRPDLDDTASDLPPDLAPSIGLIARLAQQVFADLPTEIRRAAGDIVIHVEEFASEEQLNTLDIEDPFELSGLYQGVSLIDQSLSDPTPEPAQVWLFRRPLIDEWAERGVVGFSELVAHVLIHEIGHHFGWSDEEMDMLLGEDDDA